ncbi:alkaline phosphatase [Cellulomonas bogoriensis]|uniref:Alkaline phosphatase n=1 Tax=Cellulomonas bogoriensis 69B4 = DSM 16987 TaxID=1386082 RepID=A0A0A0C091_9CELL|nr:alkaline phosphatase [Cellulomonas bogoriensis]KGM13605.1 alkaline phosphatase [Cellulomonas bogoriensis 69B4 = DSM 16987]
MRRSTFACRAGIATATLTAAALTMPAIGAAAAPTTAPDGAPKNVILLIGDGMSYSSVDLTTAYQYGTTYHQVLVDPATGDVTHVPGTPSAVYQRFPVQVGQSTYAVNSSYDAEAAWADFDWVRAGATDSAAAGTALATGVKTRNGMLGLAPDGTVLENLTERAYALGKATGLVTSVPVSHATPAAFAAHNANRNDLVGVTREYLEADYLDVVLGAGHPYYDDDNTLRSTPRYNYIGEREWERLVDGQTGFTFIDDNAQFEALADGTSVPDRVFGVARVGSTLQQGRTGAAASAAPFTVPANDVPDLPTLTRGALNVLERQDEGFFVMIEGGAIDWAGHANSPATLVEDSIDFNKSVDAVVEWVEESSSWDETLVIVTSDHETGYLAGPGANPTWTAMSGAAGSVAPHSWHSGSHTNQIVPLYAKGPGAQALEALATGTDPVRGAYLDNTDVANVLLKDLWDYTPSAGADGITVTATIPEKLAAGSLALSVAGDAVELGEADNLGDRLRMVGVLPTVAVTDSRAEATGWSVSGQSTDLLSSGARLRAGHLGWKPVVVAGRDGVTAGENVTSVLDGGTGVAVPATLATADATGRIGTAELSADLLLDVPVSTRAGTYSGVVTVSLFPVD